MHKYAVEILMLCAPTPCDVLQNRPVISDQRPLLYLESSSRVAHPGGEAIGRQYRLRHQCRSVLVRLFNVHRTKASDLTPDSMIMPRTPHTNIGDSEHPGGMQTYCSPNGKYDSSQGQLPANFWSNVEFKTRTSSRGARFAQRSCLLCLGYL